MPKKIEAFVSNVMLFDGNSKRCAERVKRTQSLLDKVYTNYELILVDNGMSHDNKKVVMQLLDKTPCMRVLTLARHVDIDTALFAGIETSIGDYICTTYNQDPVSQIPKFIEDIKSSDVVLGQASNYKRSSYFNRVGAKLFYQYSRLFLGISLAENSTYFIGMNRTVANAIMRSDRRVKHIRHMISLVGFKKTTRTYKLEGNLPYTRVNTRQLIDRVLDLTANYSNNPLRILSVVGMLASLANLAYAAYVVAVNFTVDEVEKGWTTLSLQSSVMFFLLFILLAVMAEYIGKIIVESRKEPAYHISSEAISVIGFADESRMNVEK